jgi:alpha/beta superfamily hydrolase
MRNTIVVRCARALRQVGFATLRFNFRGVEGSAGTHHGTQEIEDAVAALGEIERRYPELPLWAAGYSFGSRVVSELALRSEAIERLVLIAFPCALYDPRFLERLQQPALLVLGADDRFGTAADFHRRLPTPPSKLELVELEGADHFFRGRTPLVEEVVLRYARRALQLPEVDEEEAGPASAS